VNLISTRISERLEVLYAPGAGAWRVQDFKAL